MGVGLVPLEFTECLADSPHFRENLLRHEKELDRTSQQVKRLIKEVKDVVHAAKRESRHPTPSTAHHQPSPTTYAFSVSSQSGSNTIDEASLYRLGAGMSNGCPFAKFLWRRRVGSRRGGAGAPDSRVPLAAATLTCGLSLVTTAIKPNLRELDCTLLPLGAGCEMRCDSAASPY
ncbi:hypothetical protein MSG28_009092 [Choristoneura fumiferana]|uniref:Uncharacterized protein n=1 Tax=Choristoneura fumiferana TaxID=7141 RepID=A0ACC0KWS1_CHOFU|nr:hypothetical protein MSG28_009092 [Choristoneura fumiferana]